MICARLDRELTVLSQQNRCWYTRYADDLTFSCNTKIFSAELASLTITDDPAVELGPGLAAVLKSNGFRPNPDKLRLQDHDTRQVVTGLIVNRFPNVDRKRLHRTRAMLHSLRMDGPKLALQKYSNNNPDEDRRPGASPDFPTILRGHIEHIGHVRGHNDRWYLKFAREFAALQPKARFCSPLVSQAPRDVFFCHASEDKNDVVEPLIKECQALGISSWYDKQDIDWGDGLIRNIDRGLATSRMVVVSSSFAKKQWPRREMEAATVLELEQGELLVLPIFVGSKSKVRTLRGKFPMLATKLSIEIPRHPSVQQLFEVAQRIQKRRQASSTKSATTP